MILILQESKDLKDDFRLELLLLLLATIFDTCKGPVLSLEHWNLSKQKILEILQLKKANWETFVIKEEINEEDWTD